MAKVNVFGQLKILKRNPWYYKAKMSTKQYYLADPADWVLDRSRAPPTLRRVWEAFAEVARKSIEEYPADGSFETLIKRVKWIGEQLREKTYVTAEDLKKRLPKSATEVHPTRKRIAELEAAGR